ncbi:MAG: GNAT family N-acetyltransferase [Clostridia bacterium]|nr:GNAT family N-acetyltransferase [Clostridia bacterium]
MSHFIFRQLKSEDIPVFADEIFSILANNMRAIAPTGNSYDEDYKIWLDYAVPAWREEKNSVILIFCGETLCGYFQYSVKDSTLRMEDIQFKPEYQGCGLFAELYHYLMSIIPAQTKYVEAYASKENIKSQEVLKHLGLTVIGENKNGRSLHFKGEYKNLSERYS